MLNWKKSSYSGGQGNCVEVGTTDSGSVVGIRDTKSRERGMLAVRPEVFAALLASVKRGELDLLQELVQKPLVADCCRGLSVQLTIPASCSTAMR
jgi:hypothetical protein